jgi:hypothetical protein
MLRAHLLNDMVALLFRLTGAGAWTYSRYSRKVLTTSGGIGADRSPASDFGRQIALKLSAR